jgi:V/A-type H+/Na+-transporting ATPase subunit E
MAIEDVRREILDNAKNEAKSILKEAESVNKEVMDAAKAQVDSIKKQTEEETKIAIENYKTRVLAETNSGLKKQRLQLEKNLIQEVFDDALHKLEKLDVKARSKHVTNLVESNKEYGVVLCSKKDESNFKSYKPTVIDITGGVILEDKNGEIRLDLSYETMLSSIKNDSLSEVAQILFK